jgi:hypothetical protein
MLAGTDRSRTGGDSMRIRAVAVLAAGFSLLGGTTAVAATPVVLLHEGKILHLGAAVVPELKWDIPEEGALYECQGESDGSVTKNAAPTVKMSSSSSHISCDTLYSHMEGELKSVTLSSTGTLTFSAVTAWEIIDDFNRHCAWTFRKFSVHLSFPASPVAGGPATVTAHRVAGSCPSLTVQAYGELFSNNPLSAEVV